MRIAAPSRSVQTGLILCALSFLSGCGSLPPLDLAAHDGPETHTPTVKEVVEHIQCEMATAMDRVAEYPVLEKLRYYRYVASATLTVDAVHNQDFNAAFGFPVPLSPTTSRSMALGGVFSGQQHRQITVNFSVDVVKLAEHKASCGEHTSIKGDLALLGIMYDGVSTVTETNTKYAHIKQDDKKPVPQGYGVFTSVVDFTITGGLNGGPNWTLTKFKGPGDKLLGFKRTAYDKLLISFAPACTPNVKDPKNALDYLPSCESLAREAREDAQKKGVTLVDDGIDRSGALAAGQDGIVRTILQNLITASPQPQP